MIRWTISFWGLKSYDSLSELHDLLNEMLLTRLYLKRRNQIGNGKDEISACELELITDEG